MRTDRSYTEPDPRNSCPTPWHYCRECNACHNGNRRDCKLAMADRRPGNWKPVRFEYETDNGLHKPDDRFLRDGYGHRPVNDGVRAAGHGFQKEKELPRQKHIPEGQKHAHEYVGSVKLAEYKKDVHNHRFAGVTGEAVMVPGGHAHKLWTRTDFFDHFHYIQMLTGPAVYLQSGEQREPDDPHVHFVAGFTTSNSGHRHEFQLATLMDSPLLPEADAES